jgi:pyoverdine/dityrosine biosynthesis protein Dit1
MMATCQVDQVNLRKLIQSKDEHTVRTYQGMSRFMHEDLVHPSVINQTKSQQKKIARAVALEMMRVSLARLFIPGLG